MQSISAKRGDKGHYDLGSHIFSHHDEFNITQEQKTLYYLYENTIEIDFFTEDKILIESKFYSELNAKQEQLFNTVVQYISSKQKTGY